MDLANSLLRECQIEYDRYMRLHSEAAGRRVSKREQEIELKDFTSKWAEFVTDEGKDDDDLRPMLGLDSYEAAPKPIRLWNHYDSSALWR